MAPEATGSTTPVSDRPSQPHSAAELTRRNVERVMALEAAEHEKATLADRVADAITAFSGSVRFVWINLALIGGWMVANLLLPPRDRLDPFPFPLLTLVLSVEALFLAIFILMSQNRMESRDRLRSENDYKINLKAELEIRHLHEKVDHLVKQQWQRLVEIQQIQLELMEELSERKRR